MEHQLWKSIVRLLSSLDQRHSSFWRFSDRDIVAVFFWSVLHDRPVSWALERRNWPVHLRQRPLPSNTTMSRRLRSRSVKALLVALEAAVIRPKQGGLFWIVDGKSLPIGGASKDRQAGYGRAANCMAKGYKLHAILNPRGEIASWRVAPMNKHEMKMAGRMVPTAGLSGYLVADCNYDANALHKVCDRAGNLQLLTPKRHGRGVGHRRHTQGRLHSVERTTNPYPAFAQALLRNRDAIERSFGQLTSWGGGLGPLPAWVRTHRRVYRWVQAKLIINQARINQKYH
jgi:hypothetical protein